MDTDLFDPVTIGALDLANRVVMAPLTRSRAGRDGVPRPLNAEYYAQRAGAGLIVSEAAQVSRQGQGYAWTPGIFTPAQVEGWRGVTRAVHERGGKIVCQLWHVGRISHPDLQEGGAAPVAPSAIAPAGTAFTADGPKPFVTPRALDAAEMPGLVADYAHAARCAEEAGFDGVEIHAANCYLLDQFLRDSTNCRTDDYGGTTENRLRLPLAVVDAVLAAWGPGRVGIRLSPLATGVGDTPRDGDPMRTYGAFVSAIAGKGLAYLHLILGETQGSRDDPPGYDHAALQARFRGPVMANNGFDRELALAARRDGTADLICFGRPFIGNPDLVERLERDLPLAVAPKESWYGGGAEGYTDWPRAT